VTDYIFIAAVVCIVCYLAPMFARKCKDARNVTLIIRLSVLVLALFAVAMRATSDIDYEQVLQNRELLTTQLALQQALPTPDSHEVARLILAAEAYNRYVASVHVLERSMWTTVFFSDDYLLLQPINIPQTKVTFQ
jgi:hypothetical protein